MLFFFTLICSALYYYLYVIFFFFIPLPVRHQGMKFYRCLSVCTNFLSAKTTIYGNASKFSMQLQHHELFCVWYCHGCCTSTFCFSTWGHQCPMDTFLFFFLIYLLASYMSLYSAHSFIFCIITDHIYTLYLHVYKNISQLYSDYDTIFWYKANIIMLYF